MYVSSNGGMQCQGMVQGSKFIPEQKCTQPLLVCGFGMTKNKPNRVHVL